MNRYGEFASRLPIPTDEQTREFAEYVTSAHSWYKHLRVHPPVPFVFYLDPNSGRSMVHVSDDEVAFVDNVDEKNAFHYTWQTTVSYRRRFGHWNYHAPYGTSFQFQREEGVVDTAGTGLMTLFDEAGWLEVPKRLALAGTALLSALMYRSRDRPSFIQYLGPDHEMVSPFVDVPRVLGGELSRMDQPFGDASEDITEALGALRALWDSEAYAQEKIETHRALNEMYRKAFAVDRPFDEVVPREVSHALYEQTEQQWERTESRRKERALIRPMVEAIERERQRQISGMVFAMNQFIAVLHEQG